MEYTIYSKAGADSAIAAAVAAIPTLDAEGVQDVVGAMVVGAGGVYDDAAGTITMPGGGGSALGKLSPYRSKQAVAEYMPGPLAGEAKTLVMLTGAGVVSSLFCVFNLPGYADDCRLQVFVDGEATPSIDVELAVLILSGLGAAGQNPSINQGLGNLHVETISADFQSFTMLFPIPYSTGLVVKVFNPTAVNLTRAGDYMWCEAVSTPEVSALRLRSASVSLAANATVTSANPYDFVNITGRGGWMVYHAVLGAGSSAGWMERNINIYLDGEATPSMPSTGFEDYFRSSNYFLNALGTGRPQYSTPFSMVTYINGGTCCVALDWLALAGGVKFDSELRVRLETETNRDSGASVNPFAWLILWYEDPALAGPPDTTAPTWTATFTMGTPTATTVTASASALAADNVAGYEVSYNNGSTYATIVPAGSVFTLTGAASTTYATTKLRAFDAAGNRSAALSVPSYTMAAAPVTLPVTANLVAWWDAGDLATVTESGGSITAIADKSGNSHTLTPPGGSPTLTANAQNGRSVASFPGRLTASLPALNAAWTLVVVASPAVTGTGYITQAKAAGDIQRAIISGYSGNAFEQYDAPRYVIAGAMTGFHVLTTTHNGTAVTSTLDGTASGSGTSTGENVGAGTFVVGGAIDGENPAWSNIAVGEVIIYSAPLSAGDLDLVEAYVKTKWGVA